MKDREITLTLKDRIGKEFKFDSFKSLKKFIADEHQYWSEVKAELPSQNLGNITSISANSANHLNNINTQVINIESRIDSMDDETLKREIHQNIAGNSNQLTNHWIWSGHPFCHKWIEIYRAYGHEVANAFIEAFIGNKQFSGIGNMNSLKGAILAYEFLLQDESTLTKRRNSERATISQVRKSIVEAQNKLFKDVNDFKQSFETWDIEIREAANRLYDLNKRLGERISRKQRKQFDAQMDDWQQRIEHLEQTYQEKLRLEKPATYWNKKAKSYFRQGIGWSLILGVMLLSGLIGFGIFFHAWLEGQEIRIQLNSLQGAVLFITIISIYAIVIKTLSRMVFSSFHLQRDAEEREQLTHVYLALTHEKDELDVEARNIILQALFSRADTGLLGGDSGPTMPGINEMLKATSGK